MKALIFVSGLTMAAGTGIGGWPPTDLMLPVLTAWGGLFLIRYGHLNDPLHGRPPGARLAVVVASHLALAVLACLAVYWLARLIRAAFLAI